MPGKPRLYTSLPAFPSAQRPRLFMREKGIADAVEEAAYDMTPGASGAAGAT